MKHRFQPLTKQEIELMRNDFITEVLRKGFRITKPAMQVPRYAPNHGVQHVSLYTVEAPEYDLSIQDRDKEDRDEPGTTYYFDKMVGAVDWMEENDINDFQVYWHSPTDGTKHLVLTAGSCINS